MGTRQQIKRKAKMQILKQIAGSEERQKWQYNKHG